MAGALNAAEVARRFAAATVVKSNPVREVRTDGEYYYKLDRRGGFGLRCEFSSAQLLQVRGVPVVEHLWCGGTAAGFVLVTRALAGAPTVRHYISHRVPDPEFRLAFARFIRDFLATGLDHRDLHIGNILYSMAESRFVLVDVRGVRRWRWRRMPYDICRAPLELRMHLRREELCVMLAEEGIPDPEVFFDRALRIEAAALRRMWPKRRKQILSAYPKFTREEGALLIAVDATAEELRDLEWHSGGVEEFCSSFYWDLAEIPHRRILILDRSRNMVGYERHPFVSPLPEREIAGRRRCFVL